MDARIGKDAVQCPEFGNRLFNRIVNVASCAGVAFDEEQSVGAVEFFLIIVLQFDISQ